MTLLVRDNCAFCDDELRAAIQRQNGKIFKVVTHPDGGHYMQLDDQTFEPLPANVPGLPALIIENKVYLGKAPIRDFLLKTPVTV